MKKGIYQVYDLIAETHIGPLMIEAKDQAAIRSFTTAMKDPNTTLNQNAADYQLRFLGHIDSENGRITPVEPYAVATGVQWLEEQRRAADQRAADQR